MKSWSKHWKSSTKPRKQRKYVFNAPLHICKNFLSVNLSKTLQKKYQKRNVCVRKGDKVKIMRGQFKKQTGKVTKVSRKFLNVFVEGIENIRKDGTKRPRPLQPSNLQILELNLTDKKRQKIFERVNSGKGERKNA